MARNSAKDKLAVLPDELKEKLSNCAKGGESITDMAGKLGLDYSNSDIPLAVGNTSIARGQEHNHPSAEICQIFEETS